ncbi:MAG: valine--tRNA ligase [Candidatus Dadabacteria bacterium]|nr:MAG: valine--tRNA ligase [Candidatus Dadabacteria bacterium]
MKDKLEMPTQFDYKASEREIYALWERHNVFRGSPDNSKKPFCVVIPPPNVTGILHMGHVLDNVPQDVMTRWHRMRGYAAVWIPGTDHAGIATQNVVKRALLKEGIEPESLGREGFLAKVWEWKEKHGSIIIEQLKRLGCSCDWDRERFTMDEGLSRAVMRAFLHYYEKGLIYRGKRMINWCTVCGTALANDEVEHEEVKGHLWHFKYPLLSGDKPTGEYLVVATTRPETMLGDTAVAVNPEDERYRSVLEKTVLLPLQERRIPIIEDSFVDMEFGTGAVKVTPGHDPNDYRMGLDHKLPVEVVIGFDGKMTEAAGMRFAGLDRFDARKAVVEALQEEGLVEKIEDYTHSVGHCYRCNSVVEPMVSLQWFVKMKPLAEKAKKAVAEGKIQIIPESEKHDYFHWMDTIEDWCISRQLWWGHRIPIYYCAKCGAEHAAENEPKECKECKGGEFKQEEDVLDTWFSSQLWPFSTLGWPDDTQELKFWYPNTWLMSGRDILFFWDARMIMAGLELVGDVPFKTLALHGLVRDSKGRKLSKSLGNSPDPIGLFEEYGTDAIRAAIAMHYPMGRQDTRLGKDFFRRGQSLIVKLWNAARLLMINSSGYAGWDCALEPKPSSIEDHWILCRLKECISAHDRYLKESDFVHSIGTVSTFFWDNFCDWYLEIIKPRLKEKEESAAALDLSFYVLSSLLKLLHPYIPFVTEKIWQICREHGVLRVKEDEEILALSLWPDYEKIKADEDASKEVESVISAVRAIRDIRHHMGMAKKDGVNIVLSLSEGRSEASEQGEKILRNLARVNDISYKDGIGEGKKGWIPASFKGGILYVEIPDGIDLGPVRERLETRISKLKKAQETLSKRLSDENFVKRAPKDLVENTQSELRECAESIDKLTLFIESL